MAGRAAGDVLVGRAAELAALRDVLDDAAAGRPTIALLVGEPGIGKTRLADEAAATARAAGTRVLRGEADAGVRAPMEVWRGVHRSLGAEPADPTLAAAELRWEHLEVLAGALADAAPVLVVLEDLQWADDMAVWVLEHLPRALGDAAVAVIATSRDHEPDMPRLDQLRRVSRVLPLEGLDVAAVADLAAAQARGEVDAAELQARTGGNPLFVRELLQSGDDGGVVGDLLDRLLARLDEPTRALLATAAVAGPGTPLPVLAAAASTTVAEATDRLEVAKRDGVLADVTAAGVRFRHALLADAAARLDDHRPVHGALARALDALGGLDARVAAAGHRLHASVDPPAVAAAVEGAIDLAAEVLATGEPARAIGLLRDAVAASALCVDRTELRARALLDLADAFSRLDEFAPAGARYRDAAALLPVGADPILRARAAAGEASQVNPFVPDPSLLRRLRDALAALPEDELRLRAVVLGRMAVVAGADPDLAEQGRAWADEAVAVGRRAGDPLLVVQALLERHLAPGSVEELDQRAAAADDIVALADQIGRVDLAIQGHQFRSSHHLNRGELAAARRCLDRADLMGRLQPSPVWRYSALIRRVPFLALAGDRVAAVAVASEAAAVGAGCMEPMAVLGFELGHRANVLQLFGGRDPRAEELYATLDSMIGDLPAPFLQVQMADAAVVLGDDARVRTAVQMCGADPSVVLRTISGDLLLRQLGDLVARAGAVEHAPAVYDLLRPFAGLLNVGNGAQFGLPTDDVLARLAGLMGDDGAAVRHARAAVSLARSLPSAPMLVHCLDHLADALDRAGDGDAATVRAEAEAVATTVGVERAGAAPTATVVAAPAPGRDAVLRRDEKRWAVSSPLGSADLPDGAGVGQLARLLASPGVEVPAVELAGGAGAPVAADLGPALDAQAKRAYRARLAELQTELDAADAAGDPARSERAQREMEALLQELERAVGLGGRDRPTGSGDERARVNVVRSLRRAIAAIAQQAPDLGRHLEVSVRTGRYCAYAPEPAAALAWTVSR